LDTKGKSKIQQNEEYNKFFLERENSIVIEIFYSQMINIFVCKNCGFKSYSFEKILDIPLLLPDKNKNNITPNNFFYNIGNNNIYNIKYFINKRKNIINLMELIEKYFEGEDFQWESECENCHEKKIIHNKKIKFAILPKIIIFTIQRVNTLTGFLKNNKLIEI
jgi:ubiquitin C-terminal hydrolase